MSDARVEAVAGERYQARRINDTARPWAVINTQGQFGDEIVSSGIADVATAIRMANDLNLYLNPDAWLASHLASTTPTDAGDVVERLRTCGHVHCAESQALIESLQARLAEVERERDAARDRLIHDGDLMDKRQAWEARDRATRARDEAVRLLRSMLTDDPDDMAGDAVTVLDVWRKEARAIIEKQDKP